MKIHAFLIPISSFSGLIMVMCSFNVILAVAGLASVAAGTRAGQIEIDPQWSKLGVAVSRTVDSFAGHLEKYQATVKGIPTEANFDFADLKTGDKARNAAMLKWLVFNSKQTASFRLSMVNFMDFKLPKIREALGTSVGPKLSVKFHLAGKLNHQTKAN